MRGLDLSTVSVKFRRDVLRLPRPIPSLAYLVHTDEKLHPYSIIASMLLPFRREIRLVKSSTGNLPLQHSFLDADISECLAVTDESILEIHRDSFLTRNRFYTQMTRFDINQASNSLNILQFKSFENGAHDATSTGCQPMMLSLTESVKILALPQRSSLYVSDFRDSATPSSLYTGKKYLSAIKAACQANFWDSNGVLSSLDKGVVRSSSTAIATGYSTSAHALGDTASTVTLVSQVMNGRCPTLIFDVKREKVSSNINECASPLIVEGIPQLIGINTATSQLEVIA